MNAGFSKLNTSFILNFVLFRATKLEITELNPLSEIPALDGIEVKVSLLSALCLSLSFCSLLLSIFIIFFFHSVLCSLLLLTSLDSRRNYILLFGTFETKIALVAIIVMFLLL